MPLRSYYYQPAFSFSNSMMGANPAGATTSDFLIHATAWANGGGAGAIVTAADVNCTRIVAACTGNSATIDFWLQPYSALNTYAFASSTNDWNTIKTLCYSGISGLFSFATRTAFTGGSQSPPAAITLPGGTSAAGDDLIALVGVDPNNSDNWTYSGATWGGGAAFTDLATSQGGSTNSQGAQVGAQYFDNFAAGGATGSLSITANGTPSFISADFAGLFLSAIQAGGGGPAAPPTQFRRMVEYSFLPSRTVEETRQRARTFLPSSPVFAQLPPQARRMREDIDRNDERANRSRAFARAAFTPSVPPLHARVMREDALPPIEIETMPRTSAPRTSSTPPAQARRFTEDMPGVEEPRAHVAQSLPTAPAVPPVQITIRMRVVEDTPGVEERTPARVQYAAALRVPDAPLPRYRVPEEDALIPDEPVQGRTRLVPPVDNTPPRARRVLVEDAPGPDEREQAPAHFRQLFVPPVANTPPGLRRVPVEDVVTEERPAPGVHGLPAPPGNPPRARRTPVEDAPPADERARGPARILPPSVVVLAVQLLQRRAWSEDAPVQDVGAARPTNVRPGADAPLRAWRRFAEDVQGDESPRPRAYMPPIPLPAPLRPWRRMFEADPTPEQPTARPAVRMPHVDNPPLYWRKWRTEFLPEAEEPRARRYTLVVPGVVILFVGGCAHAVHADQQAFATHVDQTAQASSFLC